MTRSPVVDILQHGQARLKYGNATAMQQIMLAAALRDITPMVRRLEADNARLEAELAHKALTLNEIALSAQEDAEFAEAEARAREEATEAANVVRLPVRRAVRA